MVLFSAWTVAGFSTTVQSKLNASQCVILKFLGPLFKVKSECSMWWLKPVIRASWKQENHTFKDSLGYRGPCLRGPRKQSKQKEINDPELASQHCRNRAGLGSPSTPAFEVRDQVILGYIASKGKPGLHEPLSQITVPFRSL